MISANFAMVEHVSHILWCTMEVQNNADWRAELMSKCVYCECSVQENRAFQYTKIYAPFEVLSRYAEIMKYRMPIKQVYRTVSVSY